MVVGSSCVFLLNMYMWTSTYICIYMHHFQVQNTYLNISFPHLPYAHNCEIRFFCCCRRVRWFLFQSKPHCPGRWNHFLDQSIHWTMPDLFTQGWYKRIKIKYLDKRQSFVPELKDVPSWEQTTWASLIPQSSSHTVPHWPLMQISTRPSYSVNPPTSRISPYSHKTAA